MNTKNTLDAKFKMRVCLNSTCKKKFLSTDAGNRFCKACARLTANVYIQEPHKVHT